MSPQAPRQGHNSAFPNTCQEVRRGVIGELLFWGLAEQGRVERGKDWQGLPVDVKEGEDQGAQLLAGGCVDRGTTVGKEEKVADT